MTTREFQQKKPLSILFTYFKPHRGLFILDLVCATVVALIDLAFPLVTRKSMYDLLPNQQYRTFFIVMGVMMAAFIVRALLYYVISYWGHTFGILVEADIRRMAAKLALPVVKNTCPMDGHSRRQEVKELLAELEQRYPDLKKKLFGAVQRYPLYGWDLETMEK